ncbi:MAG: conjugative transposon protein TraM [Bacteroidetes bacterium GWB2_41_8]|nr:MAG: conjugative transposon protein TraM [Bacteroidetes bacterium GWB2_41_8]
MDKNNKTLLKPQQKQQLKKYAVFALMFAVCGASLWLIFRPSEKSSETKGATGLNTELPVPRERKLIKDKISAFEQEKLLEEKPVRSLDQFSVMVGQHEPAKFDLSVTDSKADKRTLGEKYSGTKQPTMAMQRSASAYHGINQTLGDFYEKPKEDSETEKLKKEVENLKNQLAQKEQPDRMDEQLKLMEKSYQLASKYMPESSAPAVAKEGSETKTSPPVVKTKKKETLKAVRSVADHTVSSLEQNISDSAFIRQVSQPRNFSFISGKNESKQRDRNTVWACVNSTQTLVNGQNVKLRLLEPVDAGGMELPVNSLITGIAQIQGERLQIVVQSLENNGSIIPVQLTAYDIDGLQGLFIPGSVETTALKEITASMGRDAGTSISITQGTTAGQQLASDVGRSLIQGTSKYISKKLQTTKVTLKAGHRLLLMPSN